MRLCSALALAALSILTASARGQDRPEESCTAQWLRSASPADRVRANAFGKTCILQGQSAPRALTRLELTPMLERAVPADSALARSVPPDAGAFCPRYAALTRSDRATFWRELLFQIMGHESDYRPAVMYWEGTEYSVGLLQMSLSNGCVAREQDLIDPLANIDCAVKRMTRLVARQGRPVGRIGGDLQHGRQGAAAYWSTLRVQAAKPPGAARDTRGPILTATRALSACRHPSR